jgi:hypothetical protein
LNIDLAAGKTTDGPGRAAGQTLWILAMQAHFGRQDVLS